MRPKESALAGRVVPAAAGEDLKRLRVLIPTSRHIYRLVSYGMVADFEDAIAQASNADLIPVPLRSRRLQAKALLRGHPQRAVTAPGSNYDVCLLVAMGPHWLPGLRYIRHLRRVCRRVAVYLFDAWLDDLPALSRDTHIWPLIDDLFVSFDHALGPYSERLPCRVHYLPQAINPRWFQPHRLARPIDVLSVGRRLPAVHSHLLELSRARDLFYFFQTHSAPHAIDLRENQELVGRLCQSSRVHVNWSMDRTNPRRSKDGAAITSRWFESAACAASVIGYPPQTDEFRRVFPYPGFVYELDTVAPQATEAVLDEALADPHYEERRALADHVRTAHTWAMRWRQIVDRCGL